MRVFATCLAVALCAACSQSAAPPSEAGDTPASAPSTVVDPANVMRIRGDLPAGYEVADLSGRAAPLALWGFGEDPAADPPQCGALADPAGDGAVRGFSASGAGGIVYAVVADARVGLDRSLTQQCARWTLLGGRSSGVVTLIDPPAVAGAATIGMATDAVTVVEGGTETRSHADTFVVYLGEYVAYVAVVTDPGSAGPPLGPDVASELLVEMVSALRG